MTAEGWIRERIQTRDFDALCRPADFDAALRLAVPSPDHYLPLLYVLGASDPSDQVSLPIEGIDLGSISMLSCLLQAPGAR